MRDFLCFCFVLLISGCGAGSNGTDQSSQLANPRPVGVQLWSVRDMLADDFEGTIRALASMGFDGVEFASDFGPYAEDAPALREFLDGLNLRASSAHVSFDQLTPDASMGSRADRRAGWRPQCSCGGSERIRYADCLSQSCARVRSV